MSEDEAIETITQAMGKAGIDLAIIYATRVTGLLPFEESLHLIPEVDLQEWNDAVEDWRYVMS
jgi:hypothetical protein